jgi:hypothetical protein
MQTILGNFLDHAKLMKYLEEAVEHYAITAPTVSRYCDDLYIRIEESPSSVSLSELKTVSRLLEGDWMHPNYAANLIYHLMDRQGMDTTGHAGF